MRKIHKEVSPLDKGFYQWVLCYIGPSSGQDVIDSTILLRDSVAKHIDGPKRELEYILNHLYEREDTAHFSILDHILPSITAMVRDPDRNESEHSDDE